MTLREQFEKETGESSSWDDGEADRPTWQYVYWLEVRLAAAQTEERQRIAKILRGRAAECQADGEKHLDRELLCAAEELAGLADKITTDAQEQTQP